MSLSTEDIQQPEQKSHGLIAGNLGEPIRLTSVNFAGISANAANPGDTVSVYTTISLTSDAPLFHKLIGGLAVGIEGFARACNAHVLLSRANTVLFVVRPDNSAELWLDAAAMVIDVRLRRPGPMQPGTVVFERDVVDVLSVSFPKVEIGPKDKLLCLLREGWRFALFFDLDRESDLDVASAERSMGSLVRQMRYADLYASLADGPLFERIVASGWFPFLELMQGEFQSLAYMLESNLPLEYAEANLLAKFDNDRVDRMFARWMQQPHFKEKELIFRPAIERFKARDPVSVIKNVLSEIEGVMAEAYYRGTGEHTSRVPKLLEYMVKLADERAGTSDTLLFPSKFAEYLRDYTYAGFARGTPSTAMSRNSVGHGAASSDQYTMVRALQALLTIDQLAFYS